MRSRTSSISSRVAPCFRAICTWAPNGLVGLTWSWLTTSTAMMISALVFWSRCGRPHASPATRTQKSPNFGFILYNLSWISLSSRTAFFGAIEPSFRLCVGLANTFAKHEVEDVVPELVERSEAVDHLSRPRSPLASDRHPTVVDERINIAFGEGGELLDEFREFSGHGGIGLRGEERFHLQALAEADLEGGVILLFRCLVMHDASRLGPSGVERFEEVQSELEDVRAKPNLRGEPLGHVLAKVTKPDLVRFPHQDVKLHGAQAPVWVTDVYSVDQGPRVSWGGDVSNRLAEEVMLVVHQDLGCVEPVLAIARRSGRQLGDPIELIFVRGSGFHAPNGGEKATFIVGDMELPVLVLARQPGTDGAMDISPVVVERLERDPVPLPEKDIKGQLRVLVAHCV